MSDVLEVQADTWKYEVLKTDVPVVVDFWHNMCGWCLKLNPVYVQLPEHFDDIKFVKVNILESEENRQIAIDHGVLGTPTIKVFCMGRDIGEIVGYRPLNRLVKEIKEILAKKDDCLEKSTPFEK